MITLTSSPGISPVTVVDRPLRTGRPSTSTVPFGSEVDAVTTSESLAALDGTTANRAVLAAYAGHSVSAPRSRRSASPGGWASPRRRRRRAPFLVRGGGAPAEVRHRRPSSGLGG